ncbi:MAG TPA: L,D-transpeptidase [Blastocatellia bacterium]|nr:L,D-transpeptidase [Blastocatellia bacterium]
MITILSKQLTILTLLLVVGLTVACESRDRHLGAATGETAATQPVIDVSPVSGTSRLWRLVNSGHVTAGDVWAAVYYPDGAKKEANPISLASATAINSEAPESGAEPGPGPSSTKTDTGLTDKSALSDELTGGKLAQRPFQAAHPNIKVTVNVPAFRLCFWQDGQLIQTYEIGAGQKEFPIDIGNRQIRQIVFNPEWVPPDSSWVTKDPRVVPGEHIPASDSRNPLGKIKIPLGDGYLIHQVEKTADIGHLVSHGCIRMRQADLTDLARKIISAVSIPVNEGQIQHALGSRDRLVVNLKSPVPISIRYDTLVVQQGVLHVYPDVYNRVPSPVDTLKTDLSAVGVNTSDIDDRFLRQMIDRANKGYEYVVSTADIRTGNLLSAGRAQPLTSQNAPPPSRRRTQSARAKGRHVRRSRR